MARSSRGEQGYGLIHADFHRDNLLDDGERLWIIDFEDFGWGHFLFDLAWPAALVAKRGVDAVAYLRSMLRGYQRVGSPEQVLLPETSLGDDLLAAGIAVVDMVHSSHVDQDGPVARGWHEFAAAWLEELMDSPPEI